MKEVLIRERNPAEVYHFHVANALLFHTLLNCVFMFSSVTQLCPTLCNPMNCSTPGFPVHHQLLELSQTHVHQVSDISLVYRQVPLRGESHKSALGGEHCRQGLNGRSEGL